MACLAAAGFVLSAGAPASAAFDGLYLGAAAGVAISEDSKFEGPGVDVDAGLGNAPALSGFIGHKYGSNWRTEMELGWRSFDAETVAGTDASGDLDVTHLMFNGLYDFDVDLAPSLDTRITPYLGGGIGPALVNVDGISPVNGSSIDDRELVLGFQGIAGLNYEISDRMSLFTDYRYFRTQEFTVKTAAGTGLDTEAIDHRFMIGFRWSFGGPEPMPQEEPAPMPVKAEPKPEPTPVAPPPEPAPIARTYIVFFDWDDATVRADAQQILETAAANAAEGGISRIELEGHADRSGPVPYNDRLSQRRAQAVADYLAQLGIGKDSMALTWKGETEPLVPTPDGVREPQNRRVEIVFP